MDENRRMIIDPCDKNGEPLDVGMDVFTDDGHMSSIESFQWDGKEWCAVLEPFATYNHDGSVDTFIRGSYKTSELTVKPKLVVELEEDMDDEDVGKRITAQMREYLAESKPMGGWGALHFEHLIKMCDAIDETHERVRAESIIDMTDESMAEHGWVKLPVDADGVPIRVWDVLDPPADCDDYVPLQVVRLTYDGYEDEWYFDGQAGGFTGMVGKCMDVAGWTHHRVPTVEDVLREFAHVGIRIGSKDGIKAGEFDFFPDEDAIAEYAKKLQLREGE